ncbi:hypothetical protein VitviT2T_028953 [Vitis vinifera]|uniref:ATPase F1/V1/A1 complex alpha/beta subunit N-terminal domain-containing protein n=1 Tax=Vitis vinifera TaxID=29760 RepID=A0ABY9DX09_VITVI|nr:hypothetical protein VitviT2T_028953 [Vitis vinifera]
MRINPTTFGYGVSMLEKKNLGRITQIIGLVLDVAFSPSKMPNIYNALVVKGRDTIIKKLSPGISVDGTDSEAHTPMAISVPDSDFHDFDLNQTKSSFGDNQVWSAYENDDGMPRF